MLINPVVGRYLDVRNVWASSLNRTGELSTLAKKPVGLQEGAHRGLTWSGRPKSIARRVESSMTIDRKSFSSSFSYLAGC